MGIYCARVRCHGAEGEISAKPTKGEPVEVVLKEDYDKVLEDLEAADDELDEIEAQFPYS